VNDPTESSQIAAALTAVRQSIEVASLAASRSSTAVQLLAVSKKKPVSAVTAAWKAGQRAFGENYPTEAIAKINAFQSENPTANVEWHFIGSIQSRKASAIAQAFQWVHSVDRLKVAERLARHRPAAMGRLSVCIQVNLDQETSKSGVSEAEVPALAEQISQMQTLQLRGLMSIPAPRNDPEEQRAVFRRLANLQTTLQQRYPQLDTLSMGMTADMEAAIAEGATIVRVGTAIFGEREN